MPKKSTKKKEVVVKGHIVIQKYRKIPWGHSTDTYAVYQYSKKPKVNDNFIVVPCVITYTLNPKTK